ncbi:MAG: hypothetical protein KF901_29925, partial [Myxococcales bacterium]|nr:hypothetical protein [Myxococcales bacterium]
VDLPENAADLYPGMLVKVGFIVGEARRLSIPAGALVERGEVTAVYVLGEGDRPSLRQIRIGRRADGRVEILAGLVDGERIAADPLAAALALRAARRGRRALVLTIDPAKRLADALGLDGLDDHVQRVEGVGPGSLDAAMLDTKASYDALISRVATGEARERILGNRVYAAFSRTLARSHAYVAAERLYDVLHGDHYDLVVLDTPPTRSALEILDAPSRLVRFLDQDVLRYFLEDRGGIAGGFASLARLGGAAALKLLGRLAGESLVRELLAFFEALSHLREGFQTRAELTSAALRDPRTAYVLVTSPTPMSLDDAAHLAGQLAERHLPPALVLYNRAFVDAPASTGASCVPLPELRAEIGDAREDALALARAFSEAHAPAARALAIAEREGDLHTVADLDELLTVVTPVE